MMRNVIARIVVGAVFVVIALLILIAANGSFASSGDAPAVHVDDGPAYACVDVADPAACEDMP